MSAVLKERVRPGLGPDTLLFGIGNCSRQDDGLGWAFLDRIQHEQAFNSPFEYRYQLQVEDAAQIAKMNRVIFIDSYQGDLPGGFRWAECEPCDNFEFTSHVLPPRGVMHYCKTLFGRSPRADTLMIQGERWELDTGLSALARENLEKALVYFTSNLLAPV